MWSMLLFVVGLSLLQLLVSGNPIVKTKYGLVQGRTLKIHTGQYVDRFHGVPFAKPPVGDLRWKATEEPEPWDNVFKANRLNAACPQPEIGLIWLTHPGWSRYSEDCLYVNIFAPNSTSGAPYPVMVWFHGGGYEGSANVQYPGHFLAGMHDVVVVVPNYRLSIFGYMSTNDSAAPGNFGLQDQVRALKFVQENIAAFGGDPNRVTLFGQSAGAASIGLLTLSPKSRGLFHQVITQSGSDQAIWAVHPPSSSPDTYTKAVAAKVNCSREDTQDMVDCMRKLPFKLLRDSATFPCTPGYFCQGFAPVVDGEYLPDNPWTMREEGRHMKVPMMAGQCKDDGSMYTVVLVPESLKGGFNRSEFERHLREDLIAIFDAFFPDKKRDVFEAINWYYSPWPHTHDMEANRQAFNEIITDFGFGVTGDIQIKSQSETNDVYYYILGYRSKKAAPLIPEWLGVPHNGELPYVFGWPFLQKNTNIRLDSGMLIDLIAWDDEDIEWAEYISTMWANFAKHGNPTPTPVVAPGNSSETLWKKFTKNEMNYLYMDRTVEDRVNYRQRSFAKWTNYLPYVAGIDFLRPRQASLMEKAEDMGLSIPDRLQEAFRIMASKIQPRTT